MRAGNDRLIAQRPWRGPILGTGIKQGWVRISGAVNPALGSALKAALVPVMNGDEHLERAGRIVFTDVAADCHGWFTLEAPANTWAAGDPVLVALLYDASPGLGEFAWEEDQAAEPVVLAENNLVPDSPSEGPMHEAVERLLDSNTPEALRLGLVEFKASPAQESDTGFTFALASCQYPARIIDHEVAQDSYRRLACCLDSADAKNPKPEFLLLLGDQVYVDATAGFFDPTHEFDRYVHPYYNLFGLRSVQDVARRLRIYTMIDDHEIEDDWEPRVWTSREPHKEAGAKAYLKYQRAGGPPQQAPFKDSTEPLWYPFTCQGISFFVADSRTERTPRTAATVDTATIMSEGQFEKIKDWLIKADRNKPKFIAMPAPLLPRRRRAIQNLHAASALRSDAWDGYPASLYPLLAYIADNDIQGVVFLSGNEHLSNVVEATISGSGKKAVKILSIHSSALHAPFPFANATEADYELPDTFRLPSAYQTAGYRCTVQQKAFVPGDGFALIWPSRVNGKWRVSWTFDRAQPTPWDVWEIDVEETVDVEETTDVEGSVNVRKSLDAEKPVDAEKPIAVEAKRNVENK